MHSEGKSKYYPLDKADVPYSILCLNNTDENYYFAVYQDFPMSPGLKSLAWQVRRLPKKGSRPSHNLISWTLRYGISIANWDTNEDKFTGDQMQDADLGKKYQVVSVGEFPNIDPNPIGSSKQGQITFVNNTKGQNAEVLDMGFTVGGNIVACQNGVHPNEGVLFDVHPTYYVALYRNKVLGQLVDSGIVLGPVEVKFDEGVTKMKVEAYKHGREYRLKVEEA